MNNNPRFSSALFLALSAYVVVTIFSGCERSNDRTAARVLPPDTARMVLEGEPASLNPVLAAQTYEGYVDEALFDGLLKYDGRENLVPDLADAVPTPQNGGLTADRKTIIYHLRHGVRWHDGAPFTSADVAFTYHTLINDKVAAPMGSLYKQIASVETPDDFTVVVHLREPSSTTLGWFLVAGDGGIIPKHLLAHVGNMRRASFNTNPVGTGPYEFARWRHGDQLELTANPNYFAGAPHIAKLVLITIPEQSSERVMLQSGMVDVARISSSERQSVVGNPDLTAISAPSFDISYLDLNIAHGPLSDVRVRKALAFAIDRSRLLAPLHGYASPATTLIPPQSWAYDEANGCAPFDLTRAAQLLDNAGWRIGPDGIRMRGGERLRLNYVYSYAAQAGVSEKLAVQLQQSWHKLGIDLILTATPPQVYWGAKSPLKSRAFDIADDGFEFLPDPGSMFEVIGSAYASPRGFNNTHYANAVVDQALSQGETTYDRDTRKGLYATIQRQLCRDVPLIPLFWIQREYGVNRRLEHFVPESANSDLWNVGSWRLR